MIKALSIKNFKSIQNSGKIEIKPIMLFIGPNSSGKTSFIQFLLAIKQTLESRAKENPILINGRFVELGTFRDLIFGHDDSTELEFDFYVETKDLSNDIYNIIEKINNIFITELGSDSKYPKILTRFQGIDFSLLRLNVKISFRKLEKRMVLSEYTIFDNNNKQLLKIEKNEINIIITDNPLYDISLNASNFFFENRGFSEYLPNLMYPDEIIKLLNGIVVNGFSEFFEKIYYLGPLREYPKRHYLASGEVHHDVGFRGEFFVDVLYRTTLEENKANNLLKSLNSWMKKFNLAYEIKLSEISQENIYSLVLVDPFSKIPVNITDVGFGVSQVLPILVEGFHLKPGSTIIVEQPEIHLHPRVQAELGDVFIEFFKEGKFSIVETHSEHLILRIQRRIAEGKIKNSEVGIYYFEPTENGTRIIEMEIDEMGMIKNWPKGFFEDDFVESYKHIEAIVEKSRKETTQ